MFFSLETLLIPAQIIEIGAIHLLSSLIISEHIWLPVVERSRFHEYKYALRLLFKIIRSSDYLLNRGETLTVENL